MDAQGGFCKSGLRHCRPEMAQDWGHGQWASVGAHDHACSLEAAWEQDLHVSEIAWEEEAQQLYAPLHTPADRARADLRQRTSELEVPQLLPIVVQRLDEWLARRDRQAFDADLARLDGLWLRLPRLSRW